RSRRRSGVSGRPVHHLACVYRWASPAASPERSHTPSRGKDGRASLPELPYPPRPATHKETSTIGRGEVAAIRLRAQTPERRLLISTHVCTLLNEAKAKRP